MSTNKNELLSVQNLKTHFDTKAGLVKAVDGISFNLSEGEALGLAGESGSGKSITCLSIIRLIQSPPGRIVDGKVLLNGENLLEKTEKEMVAYRGKKVAMILQDPLMSLNPVFTVGNQVSESFHLNRDRGSKQVILQKVIKVLESVKIPSAASRLNDYPFQFSGGMRQRTAAAIAIARSPSLLIADEPTTSLDVTIQDQFLRLLKEMQRKNNMGLIMVTHDLGIVAETCDRVALMYAGKIVEIGSVKRVFTNPAHPYTQELLKALPVLGKKSRRMYQIKGEPPDLAHLPPGCSFHPRCPKATPLCREAYPPTFKIADGESAACWLLKGEEG